jgi:ABC-2 type transport system ATP-binding protein
MSASNGVLLDVRGLEYAYGSRQAVRDVSFHIRRGEIFGLLGPNGAGKTTTIACLCGILGNWKGTISFDGRPFAPARRVADRRYLGVVPQELAVYETLTARENLRFFGRLSGLAGDALERAVDEALEIAGLKERADDLVSVYSGGMKRRLNLVAAQLHKPDLLLLDEPTTGVDPQSRNHIFEALLGLKAAGCTLIYTTHYMEEAQRLCHEIAIINEGRVAATGTPEQLAHSAGIPGAGLEDVFLKLTGRSLRDE